MCLFHDWYYSKRDGYIENQEVRCYRTKGTNPIQRYRRRYCLQCGWMQNYEDRGMISQIIFWYWASDYENSPSMRRYRMSRNREQLAVEERDWDALTERARIQYQKDDEEWERMQMKIVEAGMFRRPFWLCGPSFNDMYIENFRAKEKQQLETLRKLMGQPEEAK